MDVNELLERISGMIADVPHNSGLVVVEVDGYDHVIKDVYFDGKGDICIVSGGRID